MVPSGDALVGIADRAGYPVLTVPAGYGTAGAGRNPIGVTFVGAEDGEAALLAAGYAFEQATNVRLAPSFTNPSMWRCVTGEHVLLPAPLPPGRPAAATCRSARPRRRSWATSAAPSRRRSRSRSAHRRRSARSRRACAKTYTASSHGHGDLHRGRRAAERRPTRTPRRRASSSTARSRWRAPLRASATSPLGVAAAGGAVGREPRRCSPTAGRRATTPSRSPSSRTSAPTSRCAPAATRRR